MFKRLSHPLMAITLALGLGLATMQAAEASNRGRNIGLGIGATVLGLGLLGAYAHSRDRAYYGGCYKGPVQCEWVGGGCYYNRYGEQVCRRGHERCYRPTICD